MFENRISLFKIFGFQVWIDLSWLILGVLITWSLAVGLSIVFHELWHSLVAKRYGLPMKGITLFIFGGVAEMGDEPPSARAEFMMAIAGPLSSILLSIVFLVIYSLVRGLLAVSITGVVFYLGFINALLAFFNFSISYQVFRWTGGVCCAPCSGHGRTTCDGQRT
jgi:Zn-dependent protease